MILASWRPYESELRRGFAPQLPPVNIALGKSIAPPKPGIDDAGPACSRCNVAFNAVFFLNEYR